MITIAHIVIGLFCALTVASLGAARAFFWPAIDVAMTVGQCDLSPSGAPSRLGAGVFLVASGMGARAILTMISIMLHPWTFENVWLAAAMCIVIGWVIVGYYLAVTAWYAARRMASPDRFKMLWAIVLLCTAAVGTAAALTRLP